MYVPNDDTKLKRHFDMLTRNSIISIFWKHIIIYSVRI